MINRTYSFLTLFLFIQHYLIITQAQTSKDSSIDYHYISSTIISTVVYNEGSSYDNEYTDSNGGDDYDDEEEGNDDNDGDLSEIYSPSSSISYTDYRNISSFSQEDEQMKNYDNEEPNFDQEEIEDDEEEEENHLYADSLTNQRPDSRQPLIDLSSTSRLPLIRTNLWKDVFSKPTILVGIIGGTALGMLTAILLVMFIIYRIRKKDEGSYALEEAPRKSPSHAYTRVSSREFFA